MAGSWPLVFITGLKTTAAASFLGLRLSLPSSWLLQLSVSCGAAVNGRNVSPLFSRVETHYDQLSSLEFKAQFSEGTVVKARGPGTLIPSAQRLVWAAKQPLGNAALGALLA